jgi:hypothetical protein
MELYRFEQCMVLPADACEQQAASFAVDDLGVDLSTSRAVTVALDEQVGVVVVGWATTGGVESGPDPQHGNGADLAQLAAAVDRAYADVFASRLAAGEDPAATVADVIAHPTGGFAPSPTSIDAVVFTLEGAPPLLFQVIFPLVNGQPVAGRGTDVLRIVSVEVTDGGLTLYVYAGYYP